MKEINEQSLRDIAKIARAISVVKPTLPENKYIEYSVAVYRAAQKYQIEPAVLIAIAQQESGFREDLPEGRAGELGICQVIKSWMDNSKFRHEFKKVTERDFHRPAKSFMFSAWILNDLKQRQSHTTLPYWSFYNASKFENRFRYFVSVNRYIAALRKNQQFFSDRAIAAAQNPFDPSAPSEEVPSVINPGKAAHWRTVNTREVVAANPAPAPVRFPSNWSGDAESRPKPGSWISDAFNRIRQQQKATSGSEIVANTDASGALRGKLPHRNSNSIIRASAGLDVKGMIEEAQN